ncbi:hypothetical protein N7454_003256 [Penicillium verhagenii]|nr:hypothetical protein N7454_003256 [Penicillium verhagenii]
MHRPDDEFINQFREKFGDLLLSCRDERATATVDVNAGNPIWPASHANEHELTDAMWIDEADTGRALRLQSETFDDRNLLGSGAVFHNKAGDLHSPMVRWNSNISPSLDESMQRVPRISWNGPDSFTPLADPQRWLIDNPYFGQADDLSRTLMHHDHGYNTVDRADQDTLTDGLSGQPDSKSKLAISEAHVNEPLPYGSRDKFRYHVTLRTPTAYLWHTNESPVTYLNKGQKYTLIVADSTPPANKVGLFEYRTFVHVSFEGEDQRSNPVESWQLWKECRGSKEAHERKGKILAVEYVDPSQGDDTNQRHHQIRLEEAFVDGFCVTWTADSSANVYETAIPLKFNFLSTDFSRSKGVKGVPVRLCAKTKMLRSVDDMETVVDEPELCYCVVKLFRDHGAERKSSNDKTYIMRRIEKLNKQIRCRDTGAHVDRRTRKDSLMKGEKFDIQHQKKRKWSISSHKSSTSDKDIHDQLATMTDILSSARPVSKLRIRGDEKDDPDLYPICLSNASTKTGDLKSEYSVHVINSGFEGAAQLSRKANLQLGLHSPDCQERPPKMPRVSIRTCQVCSPSPANTSKSVACFYVQFAQNGKKAQGNHYAIYLTARTSFNLKAKLAEKLRIDPNIISRILWVNNNGLKVMVDDDMVQHLPEAQSMVADICELSYTEMDPSSAKCSEVEIKLAF